MNKEQIDLNVDGVRTSWDIGSEIEIYSRSIKKWVKGYIINTFIDNSNNEWLKVKYGKKIKSIQRFCNAIRPYTYNKTTTKSFNNNIQQPSLSNLYEHDILSAKFNVEDQCNYIQKCQSLKRIIMVLHYYQNIINNNNDGDKTNNLFIEYMDKYDDIYNDYQHIFPYIA